MSSTRLHRWGDITWDVRLSISSGLVRCFVSPSVAGLGIVVLCSFQKIIIAPDLRLVKFAGARLTAYELVQDHLPGDINC